MKEVMKVRKAAGVPAIVEPAAVAMTATTDILSSEMVARWLKFTGKCAKTLATYNTAIKQMLKWLLDNGITRPARTDLENWRDYLIYSPIKGKEGKKKNRSASTVQLYINSCKLFFRFLALEGFYPNIADHLASGVTVDRMHKHAALDKMQCQNLLQAVHGDTLIAKRDRAMLVVMSTTGCRTIELQRANVGDLKQFYGEWRLYLQRKGKTSKSEYVKIPPQAYKLLEDYLDARGKVDNNAPLFASTSNRNTGKGITTSTIRRRVKMYLRAIGLKEKEFSAHCLRHTALTQMLLSGCKLEEVQIVASHSSIATTQIYNHSVKRLKIRAEYAVADAIFGSLTI